MSLHRIHTKVTAMAKTILFLVNMSQGTQAIFFSERKQMFISYTKRKIWSPSHELVSLEVMELQPRAEPDVVESRAGGVRNCWGQRSWNVKPGTGGLRNCPEKLNRN